MAKFEVVVPEMGEGIIEVTVTRWLKKVNDYVEEDDPIVEIATDKVDSEIPSPVEGKLIKVLNNINESPHVGDVIAIIETNNGEDTTSDIDELEEFEIKPPETTEPTEIEEEIVDTTTAGKDFMPSPYLIYYAKQRDIFLDELLKLAGKKQTKLTSNDIDTYIIGGRPYKENNIKIKTAEPNFNALVSEGDVVEEVSHTRSKIAEHMLRSVQTAPHVTSFIDVNISALVKWRNNMKDNFFHKNGFKLTFTPVFVQIVSEALKLFPGINVVFSNNKLIKKDKINIGVATALPDGNLIVPVIKDVKKLNLTRIAELVGELSNKARSYSLLPGDTANGTFTITNLGQFNNLSGTPIIHQPQSAILAIGAITRKPWVVNTQGVESLGICDVVTLSLSYDHRIVDGSLGGAFLNKIAQLLDKFDGDKYL